MQYNSFKWQWIGGLFEKSLKIPKGNNRPHLANRRSTDNTVAKRKRTKRPAMIYKTLHKKVKIEWHEPCEKPVMNSCVYIRTNTTIGISPR